MSKGGKSQRANDNARLERIRACCCEALDTMREAACLSGPRDTFSTAIHGAIVELALTLDSLGNPKAWDPRQRNTARERRQARRPRRAR